MAPRASLLPALWIVRGCARFGRTAPVLDQVAMEIDGVRRTGRRWREVLLQPHHANQLAGLVRQRPEEGAYLAILVPVPATGCLEAT